MTLEARPPYSVARRVVTVVLCAIIGIPIGLFGSIFGPVYTVVVGAVIAIAGVVGMLRGTLWSGAILVLGVAMCIGAVLYIMIGVLTPDGASSGFGRA